MTLGATVIITIVIVYALIYKSETEIFTIITIHCIMRICFGFLLHVIGSLILTYSKYIALALCSYVQSRGIICLQINGTLI